MKKSVKSAFKPEYLVRRDKQGTYVVTKWEGGERPTAIYTVTENNRGVSCNCPGSYRDKNCKHIQLVKEYMKNPKSESSISQWSQDGKMHSFTYVMKDGPMIKALVFDNSAKVEQLSKPNEIVIEVHFEDNRILEARDFSWKRVDVLKDLVQNLFKHLYKNPPTDEQSLKRLLQSAVQTVISMNQLVSACRMANIEIKNGKIAKADIGKVRSIAGLTNLKAPKDLKALEELYLKAENLDEAGGWCNDHESVADALERVGEGWTKNAIVVSIDGGFEGYFFHPKYEAQVEKLCNTED